MKGWERLLPRRGSNPRPPRRSHGGKSRGAILGRARPPGAPSWRGQRAAAAILVRSPSGARPPAGRGVAPAAMTPRAVPPPPPGGILRRGGRGAGNRQVRFAPGPALRDEEEEDEDEDGGVSAPALSPLATPTLHSSRGGPGGAPPEPFDAPRAAAALLGSSFAARSALGGAAAAAMNVPPAQRLFRGLVSLNFV
ncbi:protein phosphatase 1 regulatory subunit 35 [Sylvia atricapilla]|uniref:protein phosphatase 1 regulatory subunit 35 n=1 Tax=Sylvia atricapilla TaxID=48155 RepID=UPI0033908C41